MNEKDYGFKNVDFAPWDVQGLALFQACSPGVKKSRGDSRAWSSPFRTARHCEKQETLFWKAPRN